MSSTEQMELGGIASSSAAAWQRAGKLPVVEGVDGPALAAAAAESTLGTPAPPLRDLKERGDRAALDRFVAKMLDLWLHQKPRPPVDEFWPLVAAAHVGGDACAMA